MRYIVKCLFFLLFPISAFAIDNTTKLDQLLQQKVRNNEWYNTVTTELTNTTDLKIERLNEYAINILQDKSLELKSAQRVKLVRSFVKVYDKLGPF